MNNKNAKAIKKKMEQEARKQARESFNAYLQVSSNLTLPKRIKFALGVVFRRWTNETRRVPLWLTRAWAFVWFVVWLAAIITGTIVTLETIKYAEVKASALPTIHAPRSGQ